jgi:DNA-binding MarR family transcriptional regulator
MTGRHRSLTDVEFNATREVFHFKTKLLDLLAEHFGGHTTLNHLRVGSYIGLRSQYAKVPTSNAEIARDLRLSRATVSRIVSDFIAAGWVSETPHPDDGRRRLLVICKSHPKADLFEREFRRHLNDLLARAKSGHLVLVDPDKRSF